VSASRTPDPEEARQRRLEGWLQGLALLRPCLVASWFETRKGALLTMRAVPGAAAQ
jgi:hypothetical protein